MKKSLSKNEKLFYKRIARILWENWDPIGVYNEEDEWDDEYDSYVPHIFRLAVEGADAHKIANHLTLIVRENMGMSTTSGNESDSMIANQIINERNEILGNGTNV